MSEIRTLKFPGDDAPREIVDAKAREYISKLSEEKVTGVGITTIKAITQVDYDELVELEQVSETTLYIISDHTGSSGESGGDDSGGSTENLIPYLESDGTAYINLGIAPIDGASYEVCIRAVDSLGSSYIFGNRWTNVQGAGGDVGTKQWMAGYYNGSAYATFGTGVLDVTKKHIFAVTNNSLILDNDVVTEITAGTNTKTSVMYLFAGNATDMNNSEYLSKISPFTFFYLKIRNSDGDIIYYFRPVQDDSGVACVYEAVNGNYLYNAADSGSFTYGEELEESYG